VLSIEGWLCPVLVFFQISGINSAMPTIFINNTNYVLNILILKLSIFILQEDDPYDWTESIA